MAKTFSDYVPVTVPYRFGTVDLKVRALNVGESAEFKAQAVAMLNLWQAEGQPVEGESEDAATSRLKGLFADLDAYFRGIFGRVLQTKSGPRPYYVRLPEPIENEDTGEKYETALDLYNVGGAVGRAFGFAVITEIHGHADLDAHLGNSSGSPSTSTAAAGQPISESPASSTLGCVTPSTATETPTEPVLSSSAA